MRFTRRTSSTFAGAVAVVLAALLATASAVAPAWAHGSDPTLVPSLTAIRPALPADVVVQVRTGYSEQMLVANPTDVPLTVLDPDGTPFLRLSAAGVFANVTAPFFHGTANPPDAPPQIPEFARPGAEPRWVQVSAGGSYGWFEPRLHPFTPGSEPVGGRPGEASQRREVLAVWEVDMRYGDRPVTASGVLERRPITGTFRVTADPRSDHLRLDVAQGRLPALALQAPPGRTVTVFGADGVPFLRIDDTGVAANPASRTFRDNPQLAGLPAGPRGWVQVATGTSATWLDSRLRYQADRPPDDVATGDEVVELTRWSIPVTVDGQQRELSGSVQWVPAAVAAGTVGGDAGSAWVTVGLGVGAVILVLALGGLVLRFRARAVN